MLALMLEHFMLAVMRVLLVVKDAEDESCYYKSTANQMEDAQGLFEENNCQNHSYNGR